MAILYVGWFIQIPHFIAIYYLLKNTINTLVSCSIFIYKPLNQTKRKLENVTKYNSTLLITGYNVQCTYINSVLLHFNYPDYNQLNQKEQKIKEIESEASKKIVWKGKIN